jgi:hypothetical protein
MGLSLINSTSTIQFRAFCLLVCCLATLRFDGALYLYRLLSKNLKIRIYKTIILPVVCMGVKLGL